MSLGILREREREKERKKKRLKGSVCQYISTAHADIFVRFCTYVRNKYKECKHHDKIYESGMMVD